MKVIAIQPFAAADARSVIELFRASVRNIAARDYNPAQLRAWSGVVDEEQFAKRCESKSTWVAKIENRVAGFSDLEADGHVDMLYVHPDFQGRGVARELLEHVAKEARAINLPRLYTEASITARPAFEAMGYRVIVAQTVTVRGESMMNYRMEKRLDQAANPANHLGA